MYPGLLAITISSKTGRPVLSRCFPPGHSRAFPNGMIGNPGHSERHTHASVSALYTGFEQHRVRIGTGLREDDLYETVETKN